MQPPIPDTVQSSPIVIEFTYTAGEAIRADAAVTRTRSIWFITIYAVLGAAILAVWWIDEPTRRSPLHPWILSAGLSLLTFPLWRPALMRYLVKRQHAKVSTANKPVRWTITSDALHVKTAVSDSRIDWSAILKAVEFRDGILLYTHPRIGQWLPKHGFKSETDIEQLRTLIEQRGIKFER